MVFSSLTFLAFALPATVALDAAFRRFLPIRARNALLLIISLFLYAWGEPTRILVLVAIAAADYALALRMRNTKRKKAWFRIGIALNLAPLLVYKYAGFLIGNANALGLSLPAVELALPIGISFYSFQAISYLTDAYRGTAEPQRSFPRLLLYISLFPQLIAGPIVKYRDIEPYLSERRADAEAMAKGMRRFAVGLSKKVLIANALAAAADGVYALAPSHLGGALAWIGAVAYAGQIYFDFSGYSDMAIGLGGILGFPFAENFREPYAARSIRDFWRRWHISLTDWFRDYVYIPLGGNRRGRARAAMNRFIVFLLTGLWHGANWTFAVWGLGHGLLMTLEGLVRPKPRRFPRARRALGHLYVVLSATLLFVFFRSESLAQAFAVLRAMFFGGAASLAGRVALADLWTPRLVAALASAAILSAPIRRLVPERAAARLAPLSYAGSIALMCLCAISLNAQAHNPFIYFRF